MFRQLVTAPEAKELLVALGFVHLEPWWVWPRLHLPSARAGGWGVREAWGFGCSASLLLDLHVGRKPNRQTRFDPHILRCAVHWTFKPSSDAMKHPMS